MLFFVYVAWTWFHIAYVVNHEPFAFDAWNVAIETGAKEPSIGRFFEFWYQEYTESNPRIGEPLTYLAYKYAGVAEFGTATAFLLIVLGAFVAGCGRMPRWNDGRDLATLAIGVGIMWLAAPHMPALMFCRAYATNYVWTAAILLWFLAVLRLHQPGTHVHPAKLAGVFVFGVIAGMGNEHVGPTLLLFTTLYTLYTFRRDRRLSPLLAAASLGTIVGFALIFFAPGQSSRYDEFLNERFTLTEQIIVRGLSGNLEIFQGWLQAVAPLLVIMMLAVGIAVVVQRRAPIPDDTAVDQRRAIGVVLLALLGGALMTCTVFASPKLGLRFYMHPVLLLFVGFLAVLRAYLHRPRTYAPFVVLAVLCSAYAAARTIPMFTRLDRDSERRLAELADTPPGGFYTAEGWESVNETHWFLGDDFRDQRKRELVARYFGLRRVLFRGPDVWATLGVTDVKLVHDYVLDDPRVCLDKLDELNLLPYVGRDVRALQFAFMDAVTEIRHVSSSPLRAVDLRVIFLGERPPMPRKDVYVARWRAGVGREGYAGGMDRIGRTKDRQVKLPPELKSKAWEVYAVSIGDKPRLLGLTNSTKPLVYTPWRSSMYWILACDADACFVRTAVKHKV